MDALGLDVMHEEYEKMRDEAAREISAPSSPPPEPPRPETPSSSDDDSYSTNKLSSEDTVPVVERLRPDSSNNSSTSSSSGRQWSAGSASMYQSDVLSPTINYERDSGEQKLIAVIGREFDLPNDTAQALQTLLPKQPSSEVTLAKFVPFTFKRKMLRGTFDSKELQQHDLICMCYNASEARLLLTGTDGFYTALLKHVEALLGPNKAAFLITSYTPPSSQTDPHPYISPTLRTRLYHQEPLRPYLDADQVLSWSDSPSSEQALRLVQLANMERNPRSLLPNQCHLL